MANEKKKIRTNLEQIIYVKLELIDEIEKKIKLL